MSLLSVKSGIKGALTAGTFMGVAKVFGTKTPSMMDLAKIGLVSYGIDVIDNINILPTTGSEQLDSGILMAVSAFVCQSEQIGILKGYNMQKLLMGVFISEFVVDSFADPVIDSAMKFINPFLISAAKNGQ